MPEIDGAPTPPEATTADQTPRLDTAAAGALIIMAEVTTTAGATEMNDEIRTAIEAALHGIGATAVRVTIADRPKGLGAPSMQPDPAHLEQARGLVAAGWNDRAIRALRTDRRMPLLDFADHLGVNARMISKWTAREGAATPRLSNQAVLDASLHLASPAERERFVDILSQPEEDPDSDDRPAQPPTDANPVAESSPSGPKGERLTAAVANLIADPEMRSALATRNVKAIYEYLKCLGISQRQIASHTGQSQSGISEVLGNRQILTYDVLVRIAEGLGIPRGLMGLAYTTDTPPSEQEADA